MNESAYPQKGKSVKAVYTIRRNGKSYVVRASHLEMLRLLTLLFGTGRLK